MKKKLFTLLITGAMLTSAAVMLPVQAADRSDNLDSVIGRLPDWTPLSYTDALKLYNKHGKTYLADDYICILRPVLKGKTENYRISNGGSMTNVNTPAGTVAKVYEMKMPAKPDPKDFDSVKAFEEYCSDLGVYPCDYSYFEDYAAKEEQYAFEVGMYRVLEGFDLTVTLSEKKNGEWVVTNEFAFENKDGTTVETDIYSWLPDCIDEKKDFLTKYRRASVHGGYLAFCADYCSTKTGAAVQLTQDGEGKLEEFMQSDCTNFEPVVSDNSPSYYVVYKGIADGPVKAGWMPSSEWTGGDIYELIDGEYEIKDNCSVIEDHSPFRHGKTIFTLTDADTGELISIPKDQNCYIQKNIEGGGAYTSEIYGVSENPCTADNIRAYDPYHSYSFNIGTPAGWYVQAEGIPTFEKTYEDSYEVRVTVRLKLRANGDANGDGSFGIADAVALRQWLLGSKDAELNNWQAADLNRDCILDVFDFCKMQKKLINDVTVVEPQRRFTAQDGFEFVGDDRNIYAGPGEEYAIIETVPEGEGLNEVGDIEGVRDWVYAKHGKTYGWVKVFTEDGRMNIMFYGEMIDKPVIYLYPEKETDVHVELELTESKLYTTYPRYNGGWDVTASPDGSLLNKADGTHHRSLFWDSSDCTTVFDFSKGFCIAGADTESFLREKLTYMGLTENEMNEFMVYWLPRMEHNAYNLIAFQGEAYTDSAKLNITPAPDSILRVFMTYIPLDEAAETEPQQLETFERKGFTVVEWGGSELRGADCKG
jgi:hypothetical protein